MSTLAQQLGLIGLVAALVCFFVLVIRALMNLRVTWPWVVGTIVVFIGSLVAIFGSGTFDVISKLSVGGGD